MLSAEPPASPSGADPNAGSGPTSGPLPNRSAKLATTVGLFTLALAMGLAVSVTRLGPGGPISYFLPVPTWLALLCIALGPIEVALRRSKGTNPKLASSVCAFSLLFCFALASGLGSLPWDIRDVVGIGSLAVMFLATCVLVRHRCVLGVAGVLSVLVVGA